MNKIFLIGYMGAGKTTLGKELANRLNTPLIDTDLFIENRYRKSISDMFAEHGESGFREIERKILYEIADFEDVVVATGGGMPCFFDNMDCMNRAGKTVYLQVPEEELAARLYLLKRTRPLIKNKTQDEIRQFIAETLNFREKWYLQAQVVFPVYQMNNRAEVRRLANELIEKLEIQ
ncbi:MAG: shikimate kinase [Candidatus Symbiothrix sp.]|nr:shikimate kinase [Candidatus Symbiothrix sp.]